MFNFLTKAPYLQFENSIGTFFKPLPKLPKSWVKFLVTITPFFVILGGIGSLIGALSFLGISSAVYLPYVLGPRKSTGLILLAIFSIVTGIMLLSAFKPLQKKKKAGISLLFWSTIINTIGGLLTHVSLGVVVSLAISLYFIFQIKPSYRE